MFPVSNHYWLINAHIPGPLLVGSDQSPHLAIQPELVLVDLEIKDGVIHQITGAGGAPEDETAKLDLRRGQVWSCFVDMHTHLDKGHSWERSPNHSHTFEEALATVEQDRLGYWNAEDLYERMEFGLKCSYAHGSQAIRTHLDSFAEQAETSFGVIKVLQTEWADRLVLQAVSLVPLDYYLTPEGEQLADLVAEVGGILGGLSLMGENLDHELDRVFTLAKERQLDLDFHTDESGDPNDKTLRHIAAAALRHDFSGQIVCGHCCSLAVQSSEEVQITLDLVKQANIGIVSLPLCNLFLQDRNQQASEAWLPRLASPSQTPRWRGVTLIHELSHYGIPVAVASDNCRDPFYGFGDHDGLEVFTQSVRIAQLDAPYGNWCRTITQTPADLMGLPQLGRIGVGLPADLILFKARHFSELLSRPQHDRIVLRRGRPIDTTLPDYEELDHLL